MLDLHYDRLVSDGISGWDLWLLANGWGDAAASAPLQPQQGKRKGLWMEIELEENGCGREMGSEWE